MADSPGILVGTKYTVAVSLVMQGQVSDNRRVAVVGAAGDDRRSWEDTSDSFDSEEKTAVMDSRNSV